MPEIFETYADTFEAVGNAYGTLINFNLSPAQAGSGYPGPMTTVARVRMSWEMSKVLTFILLRYIKKTEDERGVSYPIPVEILNTLKIPKEEWDGLWSNPRINLGE